MPSLAHALARTILYADVFDYPLTPAELHHYLIETPATVMEVMHALDTSAWLQERIARSPEGWLTLPTRVGLVSQRQQRQHAATKLWRAARQWASVLALLPFVRMVAVTGALAMDNVSENDDVDFFIITKSGRVWLARAGAVALVHVARWCGVGLCPNYVLARTALTQARQDLYTAHDLAQMVPLSGLALYAELRAANQWVTSFLPNAQTPLYPQSELHLSRIGRWAQRLSEWLLAGRLGDALEAWERARKLRKFHAAAHAPTAAAQLDAEHVKGHFNDHGQVVLRRYAERVKEWIK